ncbi:uncharacterized protein MONBRDRAFT_34220, partial [Monosiga brevicollis MX1]
MESRVQSASLLGGIYSGSTLQGHPDGTGAVDWPQRPISASSYRGTLQKGLRHGQGNFELLPGCEYRGTFRQDFRHGYGVQHIAGQFQQSGHFQEGLLQGPAAEEYESHLPSDFGPLPSVCVVSLTASMPARASSHVRHLNGRQVEGKFTASQLNGHGQVRYEDGSEYKGKFLNGKRHGQGEMHWPDGEWYKGGYENDVRHGKGEYGWPDGRLYRGSFHEGKRHGHGLFTAPSGASFDGYFEADRRHGPGALTYANGDVDKGQWDGQKLIRIPFAHAKLRELVVSDQPFGPLTQKSIALLLAAEAGDVARVSDLIADPTVHVDVCETCGINALLLSAASGHEDIVALLLDKGAQINQWVPVQRHECDTERMHSLYSTLLRRGADTNIATHPEPVLLTAVTLADDKIALLLLRHNTNPHVVAASDPQQHTPLLRAVSQLPHLRRQQPQLLRILRGLIEHGSNLDAADSQGNTACHLCCNQYGYEALDLILEAGANPDLYNDASLTPLALALHSGQPRLVTLLLGHGADPNKEVGELNDTLLNLLLCLDDSDIDELTRLILLRQLLEAGADPTRPIPLNELVPEASRGTVIDTLHARYLATNSSQTRRTSTMSSSSTIHAIGSNSMHPRARAFGNLAGSIGGGGGTSDKRDSMSSTVATMFEILLENMRTVMLDPTVPIGIPFCVECGRHAKQRLLAFGNSERLKFCSERCKMRALNGPHRRSLMAALDHSDPLRWKLSDLADETPLVWQSIGMPKLAQRPSVAAAEPAKAKRHNGRESIGMSALANASQVSAAAPKAKWQTTPSKRQYARSVSNPVQGMFSQTGTRLVSPNASLLAAVPRPTSSPSASGRHLVGTRPFSPSGSMRAHRLRSGKEGHSLSSSLKDLRILADAEKLENTRQELEREVLKRQGKAAAHPLVKGIGKITRSLELDWQAAPFATMSFTNYTDVVREHDEVVFFGGRDLMFAATIVDGEMIRNQKGEFKCADVIGLPYGGKVKARHGSGFMYVLRPTPELWSLVLSHRTQIIYAADIAMICYQLDLCAGSRVLETGTGSGSLTHALARAVGPQGRVFSFDFHQQRVEIARDEFARHGLTNVQVAHADATMPDAWGLHEEVDAVFFDLPKPHLALDNAVAAFRV